MKMFMLIRGSFPISKYEWHSLHTCDNRTSAGGSGTMTRGSDFTRAVGVASSVLLTAGTEPLSASFTSDGGFGGLVGGLVGGLAGGLDGRECSFLVSSVGLSQQEVVV